MNLVAKRSILFFLVALIIAFVIIPAFQRLVIGVDYDLITSEIMDNLTFVSFDIWKRVFTFYLGLWCGKAILWSFR